MSNILIYGIPVVLLLAFVILFFIIDKFLRLLDTSKYRVKKFVLIIVFFLLFIRILGPINAMAREYSEWYEIETELNNLMNDIADTETFPEIEYLEKFERKYDIVNRYPEISHKYYEIYILSLGDEDELDDLIRGLQYLLYLEDSSKDLLNQDLTYLIKLTLSKGLDHMTRNEDIGTVIAIMELIDNSSYNKLLTTKNEHSQFFLEIYEKALSYSHEKDRIKYQNYFLNRLKDISYVNYVKFKTTNIINNKTKNIDTLEILAFIKEIKEFVNTNGINKKGEIYKNIASLYSTLAMNSLGNEYYILSKEYYKMALEDVFIHTNPILYAEINYELARNEHYNIKNQQNYSKYDDVIKYTDEALRIINTEYDEILYSKLHLLRSEMYLNIFTYKKISTYRDKFEYEYKKAAEIYSNNSINNGHYFILLGENSLDISYLSFFSYEEKINYLNRGIKYVDNAIRFYQDESNRDKEVYAYLLKAKLMNRNLIYTHLNNHNYPYEDKVANFTLIKEYVNRCIDYYTETDNQIRLEESYFVKGNVFKSSWILDYSKGERVTESEETRERYLVSENSFNNAISINESLLESIREYEAKINLILVYSGNLYVFDEETNQKYLELGKKTIDELIDTISVEEDVRLFIKLYDNIGWWYSKIGYNQKKVKLRELYLGKCLDYRVLAEKELSIDLHPNQKLKMVQNILDTLNDLYNLNRSEKFKIMIEVYEDKEDEIKNYYR